ncbi:hypothetical protein BCR37DRAFT_393223 [Protomyces lactucae-debilis]|uniref:Vacuolar membrane-associated protein IML1 n=1 Tax=Protomyces lactucae-debilis TaxID=2754530 RepID=A0A1Y2FET5_PROLT|nr:uncharacterized protein BCR37DRAFT_393223 [Protomyces lactucae-debilis]ORY81345.1 hypothetical protein BCR37DRAFT_393223 [Protomyces lactucae-debilis]
MNGAKELILWAHEYSTSPSDAIFNFDLLPGFDPETCVLKIGSAINSTGSPKLRPRHAAPQAKTVVVSPVPTSAEIKRKTPNLQISLLGGLTTAIGINPRSVVSVSIARKVDHAANYMVLYFKDQYISRSDMWRAACNLVGDCIHVGKRITFTGGIRAEVREIWQKNKKVFSAYVSASTKPVFRSESARYLIFIQMSKEMWDFEEDGELFYNKAVDGFLPELFKRWKSINAHHLVSIILFTRVTYKGVAGPFCLVPGIEDRRRSSTGSSSDVGLYNDFYKVVVDNVSSNNWESTLTELKRELHGFQRDVMLQKMRGPSSDGGDIISGSLTNAMEGNLLEAINLAAHQFHRDYIDRDLLRTGTSMIFVTPGSGQFQVDLNLLKLTSECLLGNGIGIDIVCLSKRPLHVTPLFRYRKTRNSDRDENGVDPLQDFEFILPYICEMSFYGDSASLDSAAADTKFQSRCKMQEVKSMGMLQTGYSSISIQPLLEEPIFQLAQPTAVAGLSERERNLYDELQFVSLDKRKELLEEYQKDVADDSPRTAEQTGEALLGTSVPSPVGQSFKGLYELSRGFQAAPKQRYTGPSPVSSPGSSFSRWNSHETSPRQLTDRASAVQSPERPILKRPVHNKSLMARPPLVRQFSSKTRMPPGMLSLKAQPSIGSMSSAVAAAAGVTVDHSPGPLVTKGFSPMLKSAPQMPILISSPARELFGEAHAIPIQTIKERRQSSVSSVVRPSFGGKKLLAPLNLVDKQAQSVSRSLQSSSRRRSAAKMQMSASARAPMDDSHNQEAVPWHVLVNPCYPAKNPDTWNARSWRWAHISSRARRVGGINWESLCAPAALPLSTSAPVDLKELETTKYSENSYSIYVNPDEHPLTQSQLLQEMVSLRLGQGFQLAKVSHDKALRMLSSNTVTTNELRTGPLGDLGGTIYVTHGEMEIHRLTPDASGHLIEVTRYVRQRENIKAIHYKSLIWQLAQDEGYDESHVTFRPVIWNHNWSYVDQVISGAEKKLSDSVRYWRARLLFLPSDIARDKRPLPPIAGGSEQFTDEEVRVAGIAKICELIERAVYVTPAEQKRQAKHPGTGGKSQLGVTFTTLSHAEYVALEAKQQTIAEEPPKLPASSKTLQSSEISLHDLSSELQSNRGVAFKDRLWHWRWHENSFVGSELVSWLLDRTELTSREEARQFAETLMDRGLFEHVQKKHSLLDGFYLYRLKPEYSSKTQKTWFGTRKVTPSVGMSSRARASSNVSSSAAASPVLRPHDAQHQFELSRWLRIDVDPHRKSYRPEFASLHCDALYSPENAFHVRLEWIAITAKLVEELVQQWSRTAEKYGLTLIEAPVDEASAVTRSNPFRAPLVIKLAEEPPRHNDAVNEPAIHTPKPQLPPTPLLVPGLSQESSQSDSTVMPDVPSLCAEREVWLERILRHWGFVLDQEAASKFPRHLQVTYSWGPPAFKYTQYIHKSGMALCQISEDGFLWLTNRLYVSRANTSTGEPRGDREKSTGSASHSTLTQLPAPTRVSSTLSSSEPDALRNAFLLWCQDKAKLQAFYEETLERLASEAAQKGATAQAATQGRTSSTSTDKANGSIMSSKRDSPTISATEKAGSVKSVILS